MAFRLKIISILIYTFAIQLFGAFGKESKFRIEINSGENRHIRPTGYIYSQIGDDEAQVIYLNDERGTESVKSKLSSKLIVPKLTTTPSPVTTEKTKDKIEDFVNLAAKFFKKQNELKVINEKKKENERKQQNEEKKEKEKKLHEIVIESSTKISPPPNKHNHQPHHNHNYNHKGNNSYKTHEDHPHDLQLQSNYHRPKQPYGFVFQTPPTKGIYINYKHMNSPFIFANPFNFYRPAPKRKRIHIVPFPFRPPPPPTNTIPPRKHMDHEPPKKYDPPKKHEPPEKHIPHKKHHKQPEPSEEENSGSTNESENENNEETEESDEVSEGNEDEDDSSESSEHESEEKKVHEKHEDKKETAKKKGKKGHKSHKKHNKGSHKSHESGFKKEGGSKYNQEGRKRKGFVTDKGYKNSDSFGKGHKNEYDEKHHSEHLDENKAKKAAAHDTSNNYGNHHESLRGDKGGKFNEHKMHKKGAKTTGYHNVFHKDEYKKVHTFYDDADHRGKFKKFGNQHELYDSNKGSSEDHHHHDGGHENQQRSKNGNYKKGQHDQEHKKYNKAHGHDKEHYDEEQYSNENGSKKKQHKVSW